MAIVGIGVDVIEVARIRTALTRTPGLAARLFTDAELTECDAAGPTPRWERLAARFAAKEAVAKALGTGIRGFTFRDIEVVVGGGGGPGVALHGGAAAAAAARGVGQVHLSLSHTSATAVASAVAESGG